MLPEFTADPILPNQREQSILPSKQRWHRAPSCSLEDCTETTCRSWNWQEMDTALHLPLAQHALEHEKMGPEFFIAGKAKGSAKRKAGGGHAAPSHSQIMQVRFGKGANTARGVCRPSHRRWISCHDDSKSGYVCKKWGRGSCSRTKPKDPTNHFTTQGLLKHYG